MHDGCAAVKTLPATPYSSDVAFTPTVKAIQSRKGSRQGYASMEERGPWETRITPDLAEFIAHQTSVFLGTASRDGQPYIQHRGGPPGFLKVIDDKMLGLADFAGNRQYITLGNLTENPKAIIFLIDYSVRQRVKIWGEARVVENDPGADQKVEAGGLQGARRAGNPLQRLGLGHELSAAHPAALRRRGGDCDAGRARHADRGVDQGVGSVT